ncbi:MAG TPA: gamma-glutamyltransferase [Acidimicrobiales bacterium]
MSAPERGPLTTHYAPQGMVCSPDHLASATGVALLRAGGTAADAAVGASAVLAVTTPHMCGMGGDLFALVHDGPGPPVALNASGRAGSGADLERLRREGHPTMPFTGDIRSVPVPGCVDGWLALHEAQGRLPLAEVLGPAIGYAVDGFVVGSLLAAMAPVVAGRRGAEDFGSRSAPIQAGQRCRRPGVGASLRAIVASGRAGFYQGEFGTGLMALGGGEFTAGDLARSQADWVPPLGRRLWDHDVWTMPPNSQGYLVLAAGLVAEGLDLPADPDDPAWAHLLIESARQAGYDRPEVLHEHADPDDLVDPARLAARRRAIDPLRAGTRAVPDADGGTIFLCAVDGERRGVSLIQSNASGFGSLLFEPNTGINLHNRGLGFSVETGHPAAYGPGRRPPHTLSPTLVTTPDGRLKATVGAMGGDAQPQIVLQLLARLLAADQAPANVVHAPRFVLANHAGGRGFDTWASDGELGVDLEADAPAGWFDGLAQRGHDVRRVPSANHAMGHAHIIAVLDDGLGGGADRRAGSGGAVGL